MKNSEFRRWVQNLWYENIEEHFIYNERPYSLSEYFQQYKWWLKREYQYQQNKQKP